MARAVLEIERVLSTRLLLASELSGPGDLAPRAADKMFPEI